MSLAKSDIHEPISNLFNRQVLERPNQTAFEQNEVTITYHQLSQRIDKVAAAIARNKTDPESPVLVFMEPGISSVVAFMATRRAGGICALVDKSNPESRLLSVISNLHPDLCITDQKSVQDAQNLAQGKFPVVVTDPKNDQQKIPENWHGENSDSSVIVYTSGSTGTPKGVFHDERNLTHVAWFHSQRLKLGPADRTLLLPSSTGIAGPLTILRTLLTGGTLVQFPDEIMSPSELSRVINSHSITSITLVPSLFREMLASLEQEANLPTLRTIILSGERLRPDDVQLFQQHCGPKCLLLNTYGCTEVPTFRTFPIDMNTVLPWSHVPVGFEVEDKEVVLIDDDGKPVPHGDEGEIAIRSQFLARGYWRNEEETARRFISPKESHGLAMYRTGDQGYFLEDGLLVCTGRRDQQVKVMGNRVELEEIENALCQYPGVERAATLATTNHEGATILMGFVVGEKLSDNEESHLRKFLLSCLPTYMIPARIATVASLPLTPNGKINREALRTFKNIDHQGLPPSDSSYQPLAATYEAPATQVEEWLADIWKELLKLPQVGRRDDFFSLGGHSLLATQLLARLKNGYDINLPLRLIFEHSILEDQAAAIQEALLQEIAHLSDSELAELIDSDPPN